MGAKILLLGRGGQVGGALLPRLQPLGHVTSPGRSVADLSQPDTLGDLVAGLKPQVIVNAAAYTAVDKAENERELALRINCDAPRALAQAAARCGALLVHYSTDYVFSGNRPADAPGYLEEDATGPLSSYGDSKYAGEIAIRESGAAHIILRTAWVYAATGQNFVKTMRRLSHEREHLRVVDDQVGTPTWAVDIAHVTSTIVEKHLAAGRNLPADLAGVFHLTSAGRTTWFNFAQTIIEAERRCTGSVVTRTIEPIATSAYPTPARRPPFSVLDNRRLSETYGIAIGDWRERFQAFLTADGPEK